MQFTFFFNKAVDIVAYVASYWLIDLRYLSWRITRTTNAQDSSLTSPIAHLTASKCQSLAQEHVHVTCQDLLLNDRKKVGKEE